MLRLVSLITDDRSSEIDLIEENISTTSGIVILGPYEASIDHIPKTDQDRLQNISYKNKIPIYIITSGDVTNPRFLSNSTSWKYTNIIHWPMHWLSQTLYYFIHCNDVNKKNGNDIYSKDPNITDFDYTYICMNRNPKIHRYLVMDLLAKYNLIEGNAVSFRQERVENNEYCKYWIPKTIFLDQQEVENSKFNINILPKEYCKSFMQIVTESDDRMFRLTEKTATPLIFGKLFLVASHKGYHHWLRDFGFQLYNEIFDYNFDFIDNDIKRYDAMIQNVIKYNSCSKKELFEIYESIKHKIIYNRNLAIQIACDTDNFPELWNYFKSDFNNVLKRYNAERKL